MATLSPIVTDIDRQRACELISLGFGGSPERAAQWIEQDHANLRGYYDKKRLVGSLLYIPMGQLFGGRAVASCGVAGVNVDPAHRARGAATEMMRAAVRQMRDDGHALTVLYASTAPLYRRVGYETAGLRCRVELPIRELPRGWEDKLPVHAYRPEHEPGVRRTYLDHAALRSGWLDRGEYVWRRTRAAVDGLPPIGALFGDPQHPDAYIFFGRRHVPERDETYEVVITDLAYRSARGARRLISYLAEQRTMANVGRLWLGQHDPFFLLLPEDRFSIRQTLPWMLRVLDVERALTERGYRLGIELSLTLRIEDDILDENAGPFRIETSNGAVEVRRIKSRKPMLTVPIRTLAALYTGYASPEALAAQGMLEGSPRELAQLGALFAGPAPTLPDFF